MKKNYTKLQGIIVQIMINNCIKWSICIRIIRFCLFMILEEIFDTKIKLGRAQYIPVLFLSLIEVNDGAQLVLSSFLNPIIKKQWKLHDEQVSSLASIFYIGVFMGSILSGKLADKFGRKPIITTGSFLQIVVASFFFWVDSYNAMMIARILYGFSYGFTAVIVTSMVAEIMPLKYRGKSIVFENFCGSIGKMYGVLLGAIFLTSFHSGNWRAMILLSALPNFFVFIWALFSLHESPRYLISSNRLNQAYEVLNLMIGKNNPAQDPLTDAQKFQILRYYQQNFEQTQEKAKISDLFSSQYLRITICLSIAWFFINSSYFGQLVILPFIFGKHQKHISSYALTVAGEVPCVIISFFLIDRPNFGRKNSLILFFACSSLLHLLFGLESIVLISSLCRLSMKMCFQMLYPITTELFGTRIRSLGFGFTSGMGRLGAASIPFIIIPMLHSGIMWISVLFCCFTVLGGIFSYLLPYQTMNVALDQKKQDQNVIRNNYNFNQLQEQLEEEQIPKKINQKKDEIGDKTHNINQI